MKVVLVLAFAALAAANVVNNLPLVAPAQNLGTPAQSLFEQAVPRWAAFKKAYAKAYANAEEELKRFKIFVSNVLNIDVHNGEEKLDGRHGYTLDVNEFADLTNEEFRVKYNGYVMRQGPSSASTFMAPEGLQLPASVDWREQGYVTGVKNQGQCGSCWSFSATGSLEGQNFKKTGKLVSLSEQNLVDCSTKQGNQGCNGGLMDQAFEYIKANGGIDTEESYPYKATDGTCRFNANNVGAKCTGYVDIKSKDESALQQAVATVGPIAVAIDASSFRFQFYRSGVYNPLLCSQTSLDHGVLAVGYGTDSGKDYWLVKNSWGPSWGQKGYIWMARNKNNKCGIATQASYPLV